MTSDLDSVPESDAVPGIPDTAGSTGATHHKSPPQSRSAGTHTDACRTIRMYVPVRSLHDKYLINAVHLCQVL